MIHNSKIHSYNSNNCVLVFYSSYFQRLSTFSRGAFSIFDYQYNDLILDLFAYPVGLKRFEKFFIRKILARTARHCSFI